MNDIDKIAFLISDDPNVINEVSGDPGPSPDIANIAINKMINSQMNKLENIDSSIHAWTALVNLGRQRQDAGRRLDLEADEWLVALSDSRGFELLLDEIFGGTNGTFTKLASKFGMKPIEYIINRQPHLYHIVMQAGLNSTKSAIHRRADRRARRIQAAMAAQQSKEAPEPPEPQLSRGTEHSLSPKATAVSLEDVN